MFIIYNITITDLITAHTPISRPRWLSWMRRPTGDQEITFNPSRGRQHSFVEIGHEIFSTVILSLPLIQEGQLSDSGERGLSLPSKCVVR